MDALGLHILNRASRGTHLAIWFLIVEKSSHQMFDRNCFITIREGALNIAALIIEDIAYIPKLYIESKTSVLIWIWICLRTIKTEVVIK